jgi:dephospho-CoA kinase
MTLLVGLTGGIGSGKSEVCRLFTEHGVPVIDTDAIARELVAPGQPALAEISAAFGGGILTADGDLDRAALRHLVFVDSNRRATLERILHPRIRAEVLRRVSAVGSAYCVVCVPLLLEAGWQDLVQRVLVVDCPPDLQVRRTMRRDGLTAAAVEAIMRAQASRDVRLAAADDVITNDGDLGQTRSRVGELHDMYLRMANGCARPTGDRR